MIKKLICLCLTLTLMLGNSFAQVFNNGANAWNMSEILETKGYIPSEGFHYYMPKKRIFNPWKMHIYADNLNDLRNISNKILPYLQYLDVEHKISLNAATATNDIQANKAITIYPKNEEEFRKIAVDLERIIYDNNLQKPRTSIYGDEALGKTGRIFYRYDAGSKYYLGKDIYRVNDGHYLAEGMTVYDDPFHYMNNMRTLLDDAQRIEITTLDELKHLNNITQGNKIILGRNFEGVNKDANLVSREQLLFTRERADIISVKNIGRNPVQVNGHILNNGDVWYLTAQDKNLRIFLPSQANGNLAGFNNVVTVNLEPYQLKNMRPNRPTAIRTNGQLVKNFFKRIQARFPKITLRQGVKHNFIHEIPKEVRRGAKVFTYLGPIVAVAVLLYTNRDKTNIQSISFQDIKKNIEEMKQTDVELNPSDIDDVARILAFSDPDYEMLINKSPSLLSKQMAIVEGLNRELEDNIVEAITNVTNKQANLDVEDKIINGIEKYKIEDYENKA